MTLRRVRMRWSWSVIIAGALVAASGWGVLFRAATSPASTLTWDRVKAGRVTQELALAGVLNNEDAATLGPPVAGSKLVRVLVDAGDVVEKGAILAEYDSFRIRTEVERRRIALARARTNLLKRRGAERSDPLELELAELDVRAASVELHDAEASRDQLRVRAPFAGRVVAVGTASNGSGMPNVVLAKGAVPVVDVELDEFEAIQVREGMRAAISAEGIGGTFDGEVIRPPALRRLRASGGVFAATLAFHDPPPSGLRAGMTVIARIAVADAAAATLVPRRALFQLNGHTVVLTRRRSVVTTVPIVPGVKGSQAVEVKGALAVGDLVAVGPETELRSAAIADKRP